MLIKNEILCQTVCNKMAAYPTTDELKYLKKRKSPNFQKNIV